MSMFCDKENFQKISLLEESINKLLCFSILSLVVLSCSLSTLGLHVPFRGEWESKVWTTLREPYPQIETRFRD